jgi:hypothetical protein
MRIEEPGTRNQELETRNGGLILSGRLKEHDSWQVVRGEEGLVIVPLIRKTGKPR